MRNRGVGDGSFEPAGGRHSFFRRTHRCGAYQRCRLANERLSISMAEMQAD